jgi:hypothetical protein
VRRTIKHPGAKRSSSRRSSPRAPPARRRRRRRLSLLGRVWPPARASARSSQPGAGEPAAMVSVMRLQAAGCRSGWHGWRARKLRATRCWLRDVTRVSYCIHHTSYALKLSRSPSGHAASGAALQCTHAPIHPCTLLKQDGGDWIKGAMTLHVVCVCSAGLQDECSQSTGRFP